MRIIKVIAFVIVSIVIILLLSTKFNFDNKSAFDTISTFLSITTGFSITALSIIASSSFSKYLYSIEDKNDNSKTLLHILVNQLELTTLIFVSTIGFILLSKFVPTKGEILFTITTYGISWDILLKSLVWYMTIISFVEFIKMFRTFSKFVLKSGTNI